AAVAATSTGAMSGSGAGRGSGSASVGGMVRFPLRGIVGGGSDASPRVACSLVDRRFDPGVKSSRAAPDRLVWTVGGLSADRVRARQGRRNPWPGSADWAGVDGPVRGGVVRRDGRARKVRCLPVGLVPGGDAGRVVVVPASRVGGGAVAALG